METGQSNIIKGTNFVEESTGQESFLDELIRLQDEMYEKMDEQGQHFLIF